MTAIACIALAIAGGFVSSIGSKVDASTAPAPLKLCMIQRPKDDSKSLNMEQQNEVLHKLVCDSLQKYRSTLKPVYKVRTRYRNRYITNTYVFILHQKEPVSDPDTVSFNPDKRIPAGKSYE